MLKSSTNVKSPRHFKLDGKEILWAHLKDAYFYDVDHNPIQTFKYLTPQHFDPGSAEKMRNYLADDVLGSRMLEVVKVSFFVIFGRLLTYTKLVNALGQAESILASILFNYVLCTSSYQ